MTLGSPKMSAWPKGFPFTLARYLAKGIAKRNAGRQSGAFSPFSQQALSLSFRGEVVMQRVCVFCGSSSGSRAVYAEITRRLGKALAARGLGLVYGGGHVGLMGVLADSVLEAGGSVIGVIPQALVDKELAQAGLTELHVVTTMHQRKALMADLADGFAALPGAFGTADELFEILTWAQLGLHAKPIGLLNVAGYFDPLCTWLDHTVREGFLRPVHRQLLLEADEPERLLDLLQRYRPVAEVPKWIDERDR